MITDEPWGIYFKPDRTSVQGGAAPIRVGHSFSVDPYPSGTVESGFPDMWCAALSHCLERFAGTRPLYRQIRSGGVGAFTGPYVFVTDLSLRKYFKLPRENMALMFESDFFNIFNRANYSLGSLGNTTLTVGSGNFGSFGSASNPRNVQFGLKFNF